MRPARDEIGGDVPATRYVTASQIAAEHGFTPRHWIRLPAERRGDG